MTADPERFPDIVDGLLAGWDSLHDVDRFPLRPRRRKSIPQVATILALASHAHESARVLQPHLRGGVPVTLAPVVRAVLESTLTTVWVDREPDAANAFLNEDRRQRGALARAIQSTRTLREISSTVVGAGFVPADERPAARNFESLCKALHAEDLYAIYRVLSMSNHASATLTDYYLRQDKSALFTLDRLGGPLEGDRLVNWLVAASLVWSGRVVDYLDQTNRRRSELRLVASQLGFKAEMFR